MLMAILVAHEKPKFCDWFLTVVYVNRKIAISRFSGRTGRETFILTRNYPANQHGVFSSQQLCPTEIASDGRAWNGACVRDSAISPGNVGRPVTKVCSTAFKVVRGEHVQRISHADRCPRQPYEASRQDFLSR